MDLIIVGAGGMGREVFTWLTHDIQNKPEYRIKGFIDDNLQALQPYSYPIDLIGTIQDYQPKQTEKLVIAIAYPNIKKNIVNLLVNRGAEFYTLIHPTTIIGINSSIGIGSIISPYCIITNDTKIGDFVILNTNVTIGHDVNIGDYGLILGKSEIAGNVTIGRSCLLGTGTKIIQGLKIGSNTTIGAGGVVIKDVPSDVTVVGVPTKIINVTKKTS